MAQQKTLAAHPGDSVSCLAFSPQLPTGLLVASWDSTVRLYDVNGETSSKFTQMLNGACLACCFNHDGSVGFAGGLDHGVYSLDLFRGGAKNIVGAHQQAVSCMQYNSEHQLLFTGGWDGLVNAWDARACNRNNTNPLPQTTLSAQTKVHCMSTRENVLIAATAAKNLLIWDVRNLSQAVEVRESPLRNQIRTVALSPNGEFAALASTEARVAIEYLSLDEESQEKNYAFKCHRKDNVAYPINALAFHPNYGTTFVSGGADGVINSWDGAKKKRIAQLPAYNNSVASLAFNCDGTLLAVAASYSFERGEQRSYREENVFIAEVDPAEVQPKA